MGEKVKETNEGWGEKGSRWLRNINALGAVAFVGAAVLFPAASAPLLTLAAIDGAQAAFFHLTKDVARRHKMKLQSGSAP
jgi:hypothetical protein